VLATLLRRRAPDMTMLRMPFFCWTALVTCLMVVLSFRLALPLAVGLHRVTTSMRRYPRPWIRAASRSFCGTQ
jgi:heme/copper-type cytochrome/quinol oxidase subunit 1